MHLHFVAYSYSVICHEYGERIRVGVGLHGLYIYAVTTFIAHMLLTSVSVMMTD